MKYVYETLKELTSKEFFEALNADPRDIMPIIVNSKHPYRMEWREQKRSRELFGVSQGFIEGGLSKDKYWLV